MAVTARDEMGRDRRPFLTGILDWASASHRNAVAALALLSLAVFLPGFFQIPPIDRDEARFAQASKQMVETGNYVDIRFQDEVRYKKPVGIYWMQAAAVNVADAVGITNADRTIWIYRLPSLLSAIGAVLATYWVALVFVSRRAAVLAAAMMASCVVLGVESKLAKTDAMLLLSTTAAMGALARAYFTQLRMPDKPADWLVPAIFWTALAVGTLLKGPIIFLFVGLCAATLSFMDRSGRWLTRLRIVPGLVWFGIIVCPWFISILSKAGSTFIAGSVGEDMLPKILGNQEGHGAPPGYYLILFGITFWPGAVLAGVATPAVWRARREAGAKFLLTWLVPAWIVLELVVTKLPHYVMPLYPAVAILIAGVVERRALSNARWLKPGLAGWFLFPAAIGVACVAGFLFFVRDLGLIAWPFTAGAVIVGLFAWRLYESEGAELAVLRGVAAALLVSIAAFGITLPLLTPLFPSVALSNIVRNAGCASPEVASAGYQEPSLVFLAGTSTRLTSGADAAEFLRPGGCRFALIESHYERSFVQRAEAVGLRYQTVAKFDGYNISIGKSAAISIFRAVDGERP